MTGRNVRLVLVRPDGDVIGSLPRFDVASPWWPDVEPVVRAVRDRYGIDVVVLRLLEAEEEKRRGGDVTYLAETSRRVATTPWHGMLNEHPLRHPYARPGGPAADLVWAARMLRAHGLRQAGRPTQVKTWNLSSLWRIPLDGQTAWLKAVPPFFAHEAKVIDLFAGEPVPRLLASESGRMLLVDIPGRDLADAKLPILLDMVTLLVNLQQRWAARIGDLLACGLPDWRAPSVTAKIADVVERTARELTDEERATLRAFVRALPDRFAELAACHLPDSFIHGDFRPLNVRGDGQTLTILDWGDSGVGHPLLDHAAFLDSIDQPMVPDVLEHWIARWRDAAPDSDPRRALALLRSIAAARQAVVYRSFLDGIEPSEYVYHRGDPAIWLRQVATLVRGRQV